MTTEQSELRIIEVTAAWAMGEFERCLAVVWRGQPSPDAFRLRNTELAALVKRNSKQCALVEVVETGSKAPSDETRKVAMEVFKTLGDELSAIGFVIEGNKVKSALNRAILTGMMFFVKQLQPTKVFKDVHDLTSWVRPRIHADDPSFESRLAGALEDLRGRIGKG